MRLAPCLHGKPSQLPILAKKTACANFQNSLLVLGSSFFIQPNYNASEANFQKLFWTLVNFYSYELSLKKRLFHI